MELLNPIRFDYSVFLSVFFKTGKTIIIKMSLDIVTKISEK
jgi:hypothetical protein